MMSSLLAAICLLTVIYPVQAQITGAVPQVQAVYGGTVGVIASALVPGETSKSRLFVTTESANSVFYADIDHSLANPFAVTNYALRVVPDMDGNANHGTPSWLDVHPASMRMFAACDDGLFSCTIASNSVATNITGQMTFVLIESNTLFAVSSGSLAEDPRTLSYGALDASGTLTLGASLSTTFRGYVTAAIHPTTHKLYVVEAFNQTNIVLYRSSSDYDVFSAATTFSPVSMPPGLDWIVEDVNIAFGPDGRMFLGSGYPGASTNYIRVAFSTNDGVSWATADTGSGSAGGAILNICCNGSASDYKVYYGSQVSSNKGEAGTWAHMPTRSKIPPFSQVDAGWVEADSVDSQVIYFPTDKGLGASTNLGVDCFELNQGLTAVQINDMDFSASKDIAWLACQAGIRRATNFQTSPVWTDGELSQPGVRSVAMDPSDASGLTAYAASGSRIYKTTTGGGTNASDWTTILNLENLSLNGSLQTIKVDGSNVYAGYYGNTVQRTVGRFYMSSDRGSNWTAVATNIDVNDIVINTEDNAKVVYIAVGKSNTGGSSDGGIYRHVPGSDMTRVLTNAVDIRDLAIDSAGGIYASGAERNSDPGTDPNFFHLVVFYMSPTSLTWSTLSNSGLTNNLQSITSPEYGPVITVGKDSSSNDIPILAAVRTLYYLPQGGTNWVNLYTYPNGTQIRMLYWDELLVGTTIGLYGQSINAVPISETAPIPLAADFDGDRLADPAVFNTNGTWKIKLSSGGYALIPLTDFLGGSGYTALAADFDGDGKADPAIYSADLALWAVKLSSLNYLAPTVLTSFGGTGWQAIAGDFDGDRLADPAIYQASTGTWEVKLSTAGYATITKPALLGVTGSDWTAIASDFDGDGKVDPAVYKASTGSWIVMLSKSNYGIAMLEAGFLGSTGYVGMAADFDGDRYADPTVAQTSTGNWKIKLSGSNYSLLELNGFLSVQ